MSSLELTVKKQVSVFDRLETSERIDVQKLDFLINSNHLQTVEYSFGEDGIKYENEKAYLIEIRKKVRRNRLKVTYKKAKIGFGRVYPSKSISLCCMRRQIRHTLAKGKYIDIDVVNCHPVMLKQICDSNNIPNHYLTEYITNRDAILQECMTNYQVSKDQVKVLFITLLYFGTFESWSTSNGLVNIQPTAFITSFTNELHLIGNHIANANPELKKLLQKENKSNIIGSTVSYVLQEYERRVLEVIYLHLKETRCFNMSDCVLCYDGLMILAELYDADLLNEFIEAVRAKLGFSLRFVTKEMNEDYEMCNDFVVDPTKTQQFDIDYFKSLGSYKQKKIYFELFVCKVMKREPLYLFLESAKSLNNDLCMYKEKGIRECFKQLKSGNCDDKGKETSFIEDWLNDDSLKLYNSIDFLPFCKDKMGVYVDPSIYNTFQGYNPDVDTPFDNASQAKILQPFYDLGLELCEGNLEYWTYFKKFLAQMIQRPSERLPIAFIIKGKQGTGKSMFLNVIGNMLGSISLVHMLKDF